MEINNNVNNTEPAVQDHVVDDQSAAVDTVVDQQPAVEPAQPQTRAENQQFKQMRQQTERLQQQMAAQQAENQRLMAALNGYGYQGSFAEIAERLEAENRQMTVEEYRQQQEQDAERAKQVLQNSPEYLAMKQKAEMYEQEVIGQMMKDDLAAINKAFPDAKLKSLDGLSEDFFKLIGQNIDPVTAYAAVQAGHQATQKPVPPVMGAVNQTPVEKEFYSQAEYDELVKNHPEKLKDPKFIDTVINKWMPKWGK